MDGNVVDDDDEGDVSQGSNVIVLSYPAYCRYRSTLKRLEGHNYADYMRQAVVEAIGGRPAPLPNTRVVFCKDTFDYPELEDHELLCNHLGKDVDNCLSLSVSACSSIWFSFNVFLNDSPQMERPSQENAQEEKSLARLRIQRVRIFCQYSHIVL